MSYTTTTDLLLTRLFHFLFFFRIRHYQARAQNFHCRATLRLSGSGAQGQGSTDGITCPYPRGTLVRRNYPPPKRVLGEFDSPQGGHTHARYNYAHATTTCVENSPKKTQQQENYNIRRSTWGNCEHFLVKKLAKISSDLSPGRATTTLNRNTNNVHANASPAGSVGLRSCGRGQSFGLCVRLLQFVRGQSVVGQLPTSK